MRGQPKMLADISPAFAAELTTLLLSSEEPDLAGQVAHLKVLSRCHCGDSFCSTFYTAVPPDGSYGPKHRNVVLDPAVGMIVLDVVDQKIMCVEVLYNGKFREELHVIIR